MHRTAFAGTACAWDSFWEGGFARDCFCKELLRIGMLLQGTAMGLLLQGTSFAPRTALILDGFATFLSNTFARDLSACDCDV